MFQNRRTCFAMQFASNIPFLPNEKTACVIDGKSRPVVAMEVAIYTPFLLMNPTIFRIIGYAGGAILPVETIVEIPLFYNHMSIRIKYYNSRTTDPVFDSSCIILIMQLDPHLSLVIVQNFTATHMSTLYSAQTKSPSRS